MRGLLTVSALAFLSYGLWAHDWTVIGASLVLLVVWPAIAEDVRMRQEQTIWDALTNPENVLGPGDWTQDEDGMWHMKADLSDSA